MAVPTPGAPAAFNEAQMKLMQDLELEVMADLFNKMTFACHRKCVPNKYRDAELSKAESVCLDRCVAKYMELHEQLGQKLTAISQQGRQQPGAAVAAASGMGSPPLQPS